MNASPAILCLVLMLLAAPATADTGMSLRDAVHHAVHTHPDYRAAGHEKEVAGQRLRQARANYFPSLDLQAQAGRERLSSPFLSGSDEQWTQRGSLTLTQLLFDGFGTQHHVEGEEYRYESSRYRLKEEGEFLGLDVVQAYLDLLRQRELLGIAEKNASAHHRLLDKISAGAQAGTIAAADVSQGNARLGNADAAVSQARENLKNAEAFFLEKVGEQPGLLSLPDIPRDKAPGTVEDAVGAAINESPTLAAFRSDVEAAEADYKSTTSSYFPQVNLELSGTGGKNESGVRDHESSVSALAVARWNLFRGGADVARHREYIYRHAESRDRAEAAARQIERNVRDTWAAMESAAARARDYSSQTRAEEKVLSAYLDQFNIARRTLLDVLDAQNELFAARSNYINAFYAERFALFRLLALEGRMLPALGVEPPREAKL